MRVEFREASHRKYCTSEYPAPPVPFLPVEMHGNLEELAEKDENPDADDAEEARLERVVSLVAVLKTCGNFE